MSDQAKPGNLSSLPYHAYLIRLWYEESAAEWRASAQSVQNGETVRFATLQALFAFLQAQTTKAD